MRYLTIGFVALLGLAACGGSSKGASSTSTTTAKAAVPGTTAVTSVGTSSTVAKPNYGEKYLSIIDPADTAVLTFPTQLQALGPNPTASAVAQVAASLADTLRKTDQQLLAVNWPRVAEAHVKALVAVYGAWIGSLRAAAAQIAVNAAGWRLAIAQDANTSSTASSVVRHDLGLPSN